VCGPGQLQCSGSQPQSCTTAGAWQNSGASCGGQVCFAGACTGADCSSYTVADCNGSAACDVRSNTCCVSISLNPTGRCVSGTTATCNSNEAPFHCRYSCDCPAGQSCCGTVDTSTFSGSAACQVVANGGSCSGPATSTTATAQLCEQDEECKNGQACISQTCVFGAMFKLCGLQSQAPYKCTAN
jgi:hypothetical protein